VIHESARFEPFAYDDAYEAEGVRLLRGWRVTGRPAALEEHLTRYGRVPLPRSAGARPFQTLINTVEDAGLTGRGGAAFPTGRKLRGVAQGHGRPVVVANGMESEPASRKDETLLALAPHLVLDGAALAAAAVGADTVRLCLSRTRPQQVRLLSHAVEERRRRGMDQVPIRIDALPHHYVSSEETSLVSWLNGGAARPTATPPRPFEKGVAGRPTLVDNVETLAHLALIARFGAQWFRRTGRPDAPGTTLVTLTGSVHGPGVHEVPMGTTLGEILHRGGGPVEPLGYVLVGGFFGSWLPAAQAMSLPFAKDDLATVGAGPGAGVVVTMPEQSCGLAETARVLAYLAAHSARQCGPCRFGLPAVADDFAALAQARADPDLPDRLTKRISLLAGRGACRHPDGAARLAASALTVFDHDVRRHLGGRPCPFATRPPVLEVPRPHVPQPHEWR
jgi:NADH:ubiquinone oxidoreductase subunit F (NADH-binding)